MSTPAAESTEYSVIDVAKTNLGANPVGKRPEAMLGTAGRPDTPNKRGGGLTRLSDNVSDKISTPAVTVDSGPMLSH